MGGGGKGQGGALLRAGCSLRTCRGGKGAPTAYTYEIFHFVRVAAPFPPPPSPPLHLAVRWRNQQRAEKYVIQYTRLRYIKTLA